MSLAMAVIVAKGVIILSLLVVIYHLFRSRQLHHRCVRLCHLIADQLSQTQEPELVTDRVFSSVMEHTGAAAGVLVYRQEAGKARRILRVSGLPESVLSPGQVLAPGAMGWQPGSLAVSGRLEIIRENLAEALFGAAGLRLDRRQNMICIPVAVNNESHGLLQLISGPGSRFVSQHLSDLEGVGQYLDAAIVNARRIDTIKRQRNAARALNEIGLTISRSLDLNEILEEAVGHALKLMDSDLVWFLECIHAEDRTVILRQFHARIPCSFSRGDLIPLTSHITDLLRAPGVSPKHIVIGDMLARFEARQAAPKDEQEADFICDPDVEKRFLGLGVRSALIVAVGNQERNRGLLCSFSCAADHYDDFDVDLASQLSNQVLIALNTADLHTSRRQVAVMQERQRLSNELHDNMSQIINGLSLELHSIRRSLKKNTDMETLRSRLEEVDRPIQDAKASIRQSIFELQIPEGVGLWANLTDFTGRFGHWHDIEISTDLSDSSPTWALDKQREILRIVQEALWNVRKHSGVSRISLTGSYNEDNNKIRLEVVDCGRGAEPDTLLRGQGISTMRDRAQRLDGHLAVISTPGEGVRILLEV